MCTSVSIGKYTLESLTTGMYSSAKDLYREYVQNCVDSFDEAFSKGILHKGAEKVLILVDKENRSITIKDNGVGVPVQKAYKTLTDIGNSQKKYLLNRGFRGIGRLSGLTYCDKLTFKTSVKGENCAFVISFDCVRLRELLIPEMYNEYDLLKVLSEVTSHKIIPEEEKKHYFHVMLEGVESVDGILNEEEVTNYLCQVAPLPYNDEKFQWGKIIKEKFKANGFGISEYNIYLSSGNEEKQLHKLNCDSFISDRLKKVKDSIRDIETHFITDHQGKLQIAVWYSITDFNGTLVDESIKGIRARKGNILIGNSGTLNSIFKEDRFNGWFQGEVYILDNQVIPNARRDDFERNQAYIRLSQKLTTLGYNLSKRIRKISSERNENNAKLLNEAETFLKDTRETLASGFNSVNEKIKIHQKINNIKNEVESLKVNNEFSLSRKIDVFKKLDILANNVRGATNFKILNISKKLTIEQKKMLEKVFETITENLDKVNADKLISDIMEKL